MIDDKYQLPDLNCGLCGFRTCDELSNQLQHKPDLLKRCIYLNEQSAPIKNAANCAPRKCQIAEYEPGRTPDEFEWLDTLGRDFDFFLEHFPEEPGPREIILPHNPLLTREMDILPGEIIIGRPLGMSCGCPITHCGVAMDVDKRTGIITWCVTGPLQPREKGFKDIGYYIAEAYEGLVRKTRTEIKIGMRYFFQPRMCMLQWRHSGLINYMNHSADGLQVRLEGLWIG